MNKGTKLRLENYKSLRKVKSEVDSHRSLLGSYGKHNKAVSDIAHELETGKFNGSDMYNMVKALQHAINTRDNTLSSLRTLEEKFESLGGAMKLRSLRQSLLDRGVKINELN